MIIKNAIMYQITVIFNMRGIICFTDIAYSPKLCIFLEVQTDAVVVQVAKKYAVIQVIDDYALDNMIY